MEPISEFSPENGDREQHIEGVRSRYSGIQESRQSGKRNGTKLAYDFEYNAFWSLNMVLKDVCCSPLHYYNEIPEQIKLIKRNGLVSSRFGIFESRISSPVIWDSV
jgi:hypothetical protein